MRKILSTCLICASMLSFIIPEAQAATTASQTVTATLTRTTPPPTPPGPTPGPTGAGVAIGVGAPAAAAAGAGSAIAFAPLLLAGLAPNGVVAAAAPIGCLPCQASLLQAAIMNAFCTNDINCAMAKMNSNGKFYIAQNNTPIRNGTFDMQGLVLPKELYNARRIRINITMVSDPYTEVGGSPEIALGLYKDITQPNLSKKFESQQFMHHYLMKKYEIPMRITQRTYNQGVQKLSTVVDLDQFNFKNMPMQTVVRYTEGGFRKGMHMANPKAKFYAYLIEIEKLA